LSEMQERCDYGSSVIVKTISGLDSNESLWIEIENELNLSYPCTVGPIGFIIGTELSVSREFNVVDSDGESSCRNCSESSFCT
jgi:hypothetical protein